MLPITPTVKLIGTSYGKITILPIISHTSTKQAPNNAVFQIFLATLSPLNKDTILGTINPIKGIFPTVITTIADKIATIISPILDTTV